MEFVYVSVLYSGLFETDSITYICFTSTIEHCIELSLNRIEEIKKVCTKRKTDEEYGQMNEEEQDEYDRWYFKNISFNEFVCVNIYKFPIGSDLFDLPVKPEKTFDLNGEVKGDI